MKGYMQLYSMEQSKSQALEAHAADFSAVKVGLMKHSSHTALGSGTVFYYAHDSLCNWII